MNLYEFLCALIETPTISGFESRNAGKIKDLCLDFTDNFFDSAELLASGSLAFKKSAHNPCAKKLIIDAHIDTVGFVVSEICAGGFVKVVNVGGLDPYILPASSVSIYGKKVINGVFTSVPPHLASKSADAEFKLSDLYVDTGLCDEVLNEYVKIGTPCGFSTPVTRLKNNIVAGRGLDDKACVAAAMLACKKIAGDAKELCCDLTVHLSVGEEKTQLGAKTLPYCFSDADACIVLDVNFAYTEGVRKYESLVLSKGAGISYSATTSRPLTDYIAALAKENALALQSVVEMRSTGTNATQIHRNGIPCAVLSIPLKNMHTYSECVSLSDIESCADILEALLNNYGRQMPLERQ